jgi:hypothetical protein
MNGHLYRTLAENLRESAGDSAMLDAIFEYDNALVTA